MSKEDTLSAGYKYAWAPGSELSLQDYLTKFKPSMVQNDGTKPWIWVRGSEPSRKDTGIEEAVKEASNLLKEVTEKVENIKNDDSIPVRSNKKTGAKSKKEVREQVQAEATQKLKEIAQKHGYLSGKWLIFAPADKVDIIWAGIATSLVAGPLHSTSAHLTKVATSTENENPNTQQQHLICVYIADVYDKTAVTEVMKILLRKHGVNLSGVKSDLYTVIGLDSKHASGIPSTVWKNTAILPEKDIKELKDAYFSEIASNPSKSTATEVKNANEVDKNGDDAAQASSTSKVKPKPKSPKDNDPFASDESDGEKKVEAAPKELVKPKKAPVLKSKSKNDDPFEDEDDEMDVGKKPKKAPVAKKPAPKKRAKELESEEDEEDEETERPKKKQAVRK